MSSVLRELGNLSDRDNVEIKRQALGCRMGG